VKSGSRFDLRRLKVYKGKPSAKIDACRSYPSRAKWEGHLCEGRAVTPTGDFIWLVISELDTLRSDCPYIGLDYSDKTRKALSRVLKKEIK